jgi:hypothetical protein
MNHGREQPRQGEVVEWPRSFLLSRHVMAADMRDFMSEHSGQLVVVAHGQEQSGVDVNVATGNGKGVQTRIAHDGEMIGKRLIAEVGNDRLPDPVDVAIHLDVIDER